MANRELPASEWEHNHGLEQHDILVSVGTWDHGPFEVAEIHDDGGVTLCSARDAGLVEFSEEWVTERLADGRLERESDGLSNELAAV